MEGPIRGGAGRRPVIGWNVVTERKAGREAAVVAGEGRSAAKVGEQGCRSGGRQGGRHGRRLGGGPRRRRDRVDERRHLRITREVTNNTELAKNKVLIYP